MTNSKEELDELCEIIVQRLLNLIDTYYPHSLVALVVALTRSCIKRNIQKTKMLEIFNKAWDEEKDIQKSEKKNKDGSTK
jgi:hypothetical protein